MKFCCHKGKPRSLDLSCPLESSTDVIRPLHALTQRFLSPLAPSHPPLLHGKNRCIEVVFLRSDFLFAPAPATPSPPRAGINTGNLGELKRSIFPSCPYTPGFR